MTRPIGLAPELFAEQLRRAHCAHAQAADPSHACIGRCTITRDGVTLDCRACGGDVQPLAPVGQLAQAARAVVEAVGLSWSSLTPEAQRAAMMALERARL